MPQIGKLNKNKGLIDKIRDSKTEELSIKIIFKRSAIFEDKLKHFYEKQYGFHRQNS
jgi:hypothetical protein